MNKLRLNGIYVDEIGYLRQNIRSGKTEVIIKRLFKLKENYFKELRLLGINISEVIVDVGKNIPWNEILYYVFRVIDFDKTDTTYNEYDGIVSSSIMKPYGYLLIESPTLNCKARLPIIHKDDFLLAASVFDAPNIIIQIESEKYELLVTYVPEKILPGGLSGSMLHVLHFVIVPRGTLEKFYLSDKSSNSIKARAEKLFGQFIYYGLLKVQIDNNPKIT